MWCKYSLFFYNEWDYNLIYDYYKREKFLNRIFDKESKEKPNKQRNAFNDKIFVNQKKIFFILN